MPVILVLGKLSVENFEFEASYKHMGKKGGGIVRTEEVALWQGII